jgi:hypothetical protein
MQLGLQVKEGLRNGFSDVTHRMKWAWLASEFNDAAESLELRGIRFPKINLEDAGRQRPIIGSSWPRLRLPEGRELFGTALLGLLSVACFAVAGFNLARLLRPMPPPTPSGAVEEQDTK